jgi:cytochrome b
VRAYPVWDRTVRCFHWINVACVTALAAIGTAILWADELGATNEGKILLKTVHVWFGYVLAANLAWRLVWAFVGTPFARWRAILPAGPGFGAALGSYVRGLVRGDTPRYLGHNPLARIMVTVLLLVLTVQALGGLVLAGTDIYYPPLGPWVAGWVAAPGVDPATIRPYDQTGIDPVAWQEMRALREPVVETHELGYFVILGLVLAHIVGVLVTEFREGGAIVSAMFTGRKLLDRPPVDLPAGQR